MGQSASNEPSTMKIVKRVLVDVGLEGKKKKNWKVTRKVYISPYYPEAPTDPISTKLAGVTYIHEVITCEKICVDRFIGVRATGS